MRLYVCLVCVYVFVSVGVHVDVCMPVCVWLSVCLPACLDVVVCLYVSHFVSCVCVFLRRRMYVHIFV